MDVADVIRMSKFEKLLIATGIGAIGGLTIGLVVMIVLSAVFGTAGEEPSVYLTLGSAGAGGGIAHFLGVKE